MLSTAPWPHSFDEAFNVDRRGENKIRRGRILITEDELPVVGRTCHRACDSKFPVEDEVGIMDAAPSGKLGVRFLRLGQLGSRRGLVHHAKMRRRGTTSTDPRASTP